MAGTMTLIFLIARPAALAALAPISLPPAAPHPPLAPHPPCDTPPPHTHPHLKHRHNLIPGLGETVRGFATHEHEILLGISKARSEALHAATPDMRLEAEKNISQQINALIGMAEHYPDLRASSHFSELRAEL